MRVFSNQVSKRVLVLLWNLITLTSTVCISLGILFFSPSTHLNSLLSSGNTVLVLTHRLKLFCFLPTSQLQSTTNYMPANTPLLLPVICITLITGEIPGRGILRFTLLYNFMGYSPQWWGRDGGRGWNSWSHYVHSQQTKMNIGVQLIFSFFRFYSV